MIAGQRPRVIELETAAADVRARAFTEADGVLEEGGDPFGALELRRFAAAPAPDREQGVAQHTTEVSPSGCRRCWRRGGRGRPDGEAGLNGPAEGLCGRLTRDPVPAVPMFRVSATADLEGACRCRARGDQRHRPCPATCTRRTE